MRWDLIFIEGKKQLYEAKGWVMVTGYKRGKKKKRGTKYFF